VLPIIGSLSFFYCSDGNLQPDDPTRFDYATFTIMVNTPATGEIGRLWIVSDIDFSEPIPISTWPLLNEAKSLSAHGSREAGTGPFSSISIDTAVAEISFPSSDATIQFPLQGSYFVVYTAFDTTASHYTSPSNLVSLGANLSALNLFNNNVFDSVNLFVTVATSCIAAVTVNAPLDPANPTANQLILSGGAVSVGTDNINYTVNIFPIPNSLISIRAKELLDEEKEYEAFQRFLIRLRNEQKKNRRIVIQDNDLYEISDVNIEPEELVSFPGDKFKLSQKQLVSPTIVVEEKKEGVTRKSGFFSTSR